MAEAVEWVIKHTELPDNLQRIKDDYEINLVYEVQSCSKGPGVLGKRKRSNYAKYPGGAKLDMARWLVSQTRLRLAPKKHFRGKLFLEVSRWIGMPSDELEMAEAVEGMVALTGQGPVATESSLLPKPGEGQTS